MDKAGKDAMKSTFYQKVSNFALKEIVSFLDHNQTEMTIKIGDQYLKTNINYIKNEKYFSILKFHAHDFENEPVICNFRVKEEIYFFKSFLNSTKTDYTIDIPNEVFQLQRRNDFRISVPMGLGYQCVITSVNGKETEVKAEIRDLSMGGCQLSAPGNEVEVIPETLFELKISVADRFEFTNLELKARHVKYIDNQDNVIIGASFLDLKGEKLTDMQSLLMYIDRFARGKSKE